MADNLTLNAGSGGATLAADDVGVHYQIVKISTGALDAAGSPVSDSNPMPVDDAGGSLTVDNAGTFAVQVDGDALTALQLIDDAVYTDATGTPSKGVAVMGTDGTNPQLIAVDTSGNVQVDLVTANVTNAGTFAVQVDGDALTALQLIDNIVQVEDAVHGTGDSGVMALAVRNDTLAALAGTDGDYAPLQVNASGALFIQEGSALDVSAATVTVDNGGTFATQAAQSGTWNITNVSGTVSLPTGAATAAKQPALGTAGSAASDVISVQGIASMTALVVDGSAVTQPVSGTITANLSATDNAVLDVIETNTSGNTSHYRNIDANAEAEIKGSAGTLKWLHAMNLTAAKAYVHLYDQVAASVTPGTTTPSYTFPLATQGDTNGAGFVLPAQIEFGTGITLVVTTTLDGSTGDPGTNGVIVNAGYV